MNRDDIIRMAQEARLAFDCDDYPDIWQTYMNVGREEIEHFAALVAAAEREACATYLERGVDLGGLAEHPAWQNYTADLLACCAAAIRSRGQQ